MTRTDTAGLDAQRPAPPPGRSLWGDAWTRLRANKAAVASTIVLVVVAIACLAGPWLTPHRFDAVYPSYVKVPASLRAYPEEAMVEPILERALRRARLTLEAWRVEGDRVVVEVTSRRAIDARTTRYLDRADIFEDARVVATSAVMYSSGR